MRNRPLPLLASAALLALAAVAFAQDRGHHDGDGKPSRSRASRNDTRRPSLGRRDGDRDSRSGSDRRNPSERGDRRPGDELDAVRGDHPYRAPERYDGRGRYEPVRFGTPPLHSVLGVQIGRSDTRRGTDVAVSAQVGGLRVGYTSYDSRSRRRDDLSVGFGFPFYAYDPYAPNVVVVASPWYRYSYLPPYLDRTHVVIVDDYPARWEWDGWRRYDAEDRRDPAVQDSLDDLRDAFERGSDPIAERLVPERGDVAIYNDGKYDYSLNPDDFEKMLLDGIEQSQTVRYEILEARTRGDEVRVRARHTFEDSWGKQQSAVHTITLRRENGGDYVIREFGTE